MAESAVVSREVATAAASLIGWSIWTVVKLDFAVWATDDENEGRLFLVPSDRKPKRN